MSTTGLDNLLGSPIRLPGHFDAPVVLEGARPIGNSFECRVRLSDGTLEELVISHDEASALAASTVGLHSLKLVDGQDLQLVVESARIRLAYAHDSQFAVSLSGI